MYFIILDQCSDDASQIFSDQWSDVASQDQCSDAASRTFSDQWSDVASRTFSDQCSDVASQTSSIETSMNSKFFFQGPSRK